MSFAAGSQLQSNKRSHSNVLWLQDGQERDAFFKRLPAQLPNIPVPVAQRKLLPMISQALEFGGAPAVALGESCGHVYTLSCGLLTPLL